MTFLQVLILVGILWVALSVVVGMLFGAVAKDDSVYADEEDCWPCSIDQRRD